MRHVSNRTDIHRTVLETVFNTVVPTEVSHVTISTTVVNNITTTIPVVLYSTIDYTVTAIESATATEVVSETATEFVSVTETDTVTETETVTETVDPAVTPYKRHADDDDEYDMPEYASACTDIFQYSSACDCIGFVPSTSTAPAPETTSTIFSTVTPYTNTVISTVTTLSFTRNATTIPVTTTVSTISVSHPVETTPVTTIVGTQTVTTVVATDTITTIVGTSTVTETETTTTTTTSRPAYTTYTGMIEMDSVNKLEDIRVPPGAEIGVIATIRSTTTPARVRVMPDGAVTLFQTPATTVPYNFYYYSRNTAFSYVQFTTERVSNILGVQKLYCDIAPGGSSSRDLRCYHQSKQVDFWLCGRHLAVVFEQGSDVFARSCVSTAAVQISPYMRVQTIETSQ